MPHGAIERRAKVCIEATFGTLSTGCRRLTRHWEHSPTAVEDAISIANCHRLLRAYDRPQDCVA